MFTLLTSLNFVISLSDSQEEALKDKTGAFLIATHAVHHAQEGRKQGSQRNDKAKSRQGV